MTLLRSRYNPVTTLLWSHYNPFMTPLRSCYDLVTIPLPSCYYPILTLLRSGYDLGMIPPLGATERGVIYSKWLSILHYFEHVREPKKNLPVEAHHWLSTAQSKRGQMSSLSHLSGRIRRSSLFNAQVAELLELFEESLLKLIEKVLFSYYKDQLVECNWLKVLLLCWCCCVLWLPLQCRKMGRF